jgi:hypothetical protein
MSEQRNSERFSQADYLLDCVLARYTSEPLAGLENRSLIRLRAQQGVVAQKFFRWRACVADTAAVAGVCAALAASLAIGIQIGQHRANLVWQKRLADSSASSATKRPNVPLTAAANTSPRIRRVNAGAAAVRPSSRPAAQFPSPSPLTAQERALARLASTADSAVLSSLIHATHPIEIVPQDNLGSASQPLQ